MYFMFMYDISISLVLYKNNIQDIQQLINDIFKNKLNIQLCILDNSPKKIFKTDFENKNISYIHLPNNIGFGSAHNIAIKKDSKNSKYHLIINPDIFLNNPAILESLFTYMESNKDISALMPKILFPDNSIQYLCRLLPNPTDLFIRRFFSYSKYNHKRQYDYEMRFFNYNKIVELAWISGCFMFLRSDALLRTNGFDEQFFMYCEDIDLSRKIINYGKIVFYPHETIIHNYEKGSYKSKYLLLIHIISAIKYFNKWGWFNDKKRNEINQSIYKKIITT